MKKKLTERNAVECPPHDRDDERSWVQRPGHITACFFTGQVQVSTFWQLLLETPEIGFCGNQDNNRPLYSLLEMTLNVISQIRSEMSPN
jgi:hypothetical protein